MSLRLPPLTVFTLFLPLNPLLLSNLGAQTPSDPATIELVREAVAGHSEQAHATHRFTFYELAHTQNRNAKGKLFFDRSTLTETTYIADIPFDRLLEIDGKPLTGKALAEEQARYDQAVHDRSALDVEARARIDNQRFINAGLPYSHLTTRFHLTDLRQETVHTSTGDLLAHVIDAVPIVSTNPALPTESRHIQLWIAPAAAGSTSGTPPHLLRADFEYLTPDATTGVEIERGSRGTTLYTVIDGIDVAERKELHTHVFLGKHHADDKPMQVDVERTYSHYRQFTTEVHILPATTQ